MTDKRALDSREQISSAKNTMRGALGNRGNKGNKHNKHNTLNTQNDTDPPLELLSKLLEELPWRETPEFAVWVDRYPAPLLRLYPPRRVKSYSELWSGAYLRTSDLSVQLYWISRFLNRNHSVIEAFLRQLAGYELALLSGRHEEALTVLDTIEAEHGPSIWLIEARIAVLHRCRGIEAQKGYARQIHEAAPGTVPAYFAHYVSRRNEDSTSLDRYASRVRQEVDNQPIRDATKLYLRYQLASENIFEADEPTLCTFLCVASSISIIDAYEAHIEILQMVLQRRDSQAALTAAEYSLAELAVSDWRVDKLRALASGDMSYVPLRPVADADAYLRGEFSASIELAVGMAEENPTDIDALANAAIATASGGLGPATTSLSPLQNEILAVLTSLYGRRNGAPKAASDIAKLSTNLRTLRVAGALRGYLATIYLDQPQVGASFGTAIFLSSATLNPRHWTVLPPPAAKRLLERCRATMGSSVTVMAALSQYCGDPVMVEGSPEEVVCVLNIESALYNGQLSQALRCARCLQCSSAEIWRHLGAKTELYCLLAAGEVDEAVRVAASLCCADLEVGNALPLRTILGGRRWRDVRHLAADISLPILFDVFWRVVGTGEHETTRRIAYDEFLKAHHCTKPSELADFVDSFEREQLVVCGKQINDYPTQRGHA